MVGRVFCEKKKKEKRSGNRRIDVNASYSCANTREATLSSLSLLSEN